MEWYEVRHSIKMSVVFEMYVVTRVRLVSRESELVLNQ